MCFNWVPKNLFFSQKSINGYVNLHWYVNWNYSFTKFVSQSTSLVLWTNTVFGNQIHFLEIRVFLFNYTYHRRYLYSGKTSDRPISSVFSDEEHSSLAIFTSMTRISGVPRKFFFGEELNKFSWGQRTERTGICGR